MILERKSMEGVCGVRKIVIRRILIGSACQPRTILDVGLALPTLPVEPLVEGVTTGRQDPKVVAQPDHIVRSAHEEFPDALSLQRWCHRNAFDVADAQGLIADPYGRGTTAV